MRESGAAGTKGQKTPRASAAEARGVSVCSARRDGTQRPVFFSHPPGNAIAKPVRSTPVSVCSLYQIRPLFAIDSNVKNSTIFSLFFARPSCRNTKFHFLSSPGGCLSAVSGVQHGRSSDSGEKNARPPRHLIWRCRPAPPHLKTPGIQSNFPLQIGQTVLY